MNRHAGRAAAQIPWAIQPRPDTGLSSSRLGLGLLVASEFMLLAGLFSAAVFLRLAATSWPLDALEHGLPLVATIVVAGSTLSLWFARRAAGIHRGETRLFGGAGFLLGMFALFIRSAEWSILAGMGRTPAAHNLYGIYFVLTGVVAVLMAANLAVLAWLLVTGGTMVEREPDRFRERMHGTVMHWLFLVVIWLVILVMFR